MSSSSRRNPAKSTIRRGFTLIELMVVVVVIGALASIAIPKFASAKDKAHVAAMRNDLRALVTAQLIYRDEHNPPAFATTVEELGDRFRPSTGVTVTIVAEDDGTVGARARHEASRVTCAIFEGDTPVTPAVTEGVIACQ